MIDQQTPLTNEERRPRIIVAMEGGVIQDVVFPPGVHNVVLEARDYDVEGRNLEDGNIKRNKHGEQYIECLWMPPESEERDNPLRLVIERAEDALRNLENEEPIGTEINLRRIVDVAAAALSKERSSKVGPERLARRLYGVDDVCEGDRYIRLAMESTNPVLHGKGRLWKVVAMELSREKTADERKAVYNCTIEAEDTHDRTVVADYELRTGAWQRAPLIEKKGATP